MSELSERLRGAITASGGIDLRDPEALRQAADRIEALEAALKEADGVVETLARSRRSHGYVIASVASMDGLLEGYLTYRERADSSETASLSPSLQPLPDEGERK